MKHRLSRGEWLLICGPVVAFGVFGAFYARWKLLAPATLNPSPVSLFSLFVTSDGRWVIGLGAALDAKNKRPPGTPYQFLRWSTKDGKINNQLSEYRSFYDWTVSRDGERVAFYIPAPYNPVTKQRGYGTVVVRSAEDGTDIGSWTLTGVRDYSRRMVFSPDGHELMTLGNHLERYDVTSGKLLGTLSAQQVFSPQSTFYNAIFSPDGRYVALVEGATSSASELPNSRSKVTPRSYVNLGGRLEILTFPGLKTVWRPPGDLYSSCSWESNTRLWATAPLMLRYRPQKIVRASLDLQSKKSQLDVLEFSSQLNWNQETLSVNGATGRAVMVGRDANNSSQCVVWGRDGKVETSYNFRLHDQPKGGSPLPGDDAPPRFLKDGRTLVRINDKNIERYDLSRYLPQSTVEATATP